MKKLLLLLVVFAIPLVAAQPVVDFHQFYGNVIGAAEGDEVQAHINDAVYKTNVKNGKYGYDPLFLIGDGSDGDAITFYVQEKKIREYTFEEGAATKLALQYAEPAPAPAPSSGGGGGGSPAREFYDTPTEAPGAAECYDDWFCQPWSACAAGMQTRTCALNDYPECNLQWAMPVTEQACEMPIPAATCVDNMLNQGETGIDCGGPCAPCPSCFDNVQNQGETGIDCGGPCEPCAPTVEVPVVVKKQLDLGWLWILLSFLILVGIAITAVVFFEKRHKEEVLDEKYREVAEWVAQHRKQGVSKAKIREALEKQGWSKDDIKKLI